MSDASAHEPTAPERATGRRPLVIAAAIIVVLTIIAALVFGAAVLYNHGKDEGACDKQAEDIESGYTAYIKAHELGYTTTFTRGKGCTDVNVKLTRLTKSKDGTHATKVTCPTTKVKLANKTHPSPYTLTVECEVVDTSTIKVRIGDPVKPGG